MFTGIIQATGQVKKLTENQLIVEAPDDIIKEIKKGSSIAVDGVCLTAIELSNKSFIADFMPETAQKTIIGNYKEGQLINLELAMLASGRFDGHIVSGHVDSIGEIASMESDGNAYLLHIKLTDELIRYVIPKGSITINGISLTVVDVGGSQLTVSIMPHTWEVTNLHTLKISSKVNVETDMLGKYVEKLIK